MKVIAEPTENGFMLMLGGGEFLHSHRPSVVTYDDFLNTKVVRGQVKVLEKDLPDEASDAEFEKTLNASSGDKELAVSSFVSTFKPKEETEEEKKTREKAEKDAKK